LPPALPGTHPFGGAARTVERRRPGGILDLLIFTLAARATEYPDLRLKYPELALLLITVISTLPMVAWMRFRGMAWRPIREMAGASIVLAVVLIALAGLGYISDASFHQWGGAGLSERRHGRSGDSMDAEGLPEARASTVR
jgi:hypothetical protein